MEGAGEMDGAVEMVGGEIEGELEEAGEVEVGAVDVEGARGEVDGVREVEEEGEIEGSMSCLLAASTRTFSCARKGIPRMASWRDRGATAKITGLLLVQDLEGMETWETTCLSTRTPLGVTA
jgi:hypothetical protein